MIIDARVRPPYKSLQLVLAAAPGAPKPVKRSPLIRLRASTVNGTEIARVVHS
jgi:hypothetical protein